MANTSQKILPEFQEFLFERKLAHAKHIPFLAYWVRRYLNFARKRDITGTKSPIDALYGPQKS